MTNCTPEARARLLLTGLAGTLTALAIAALCIGAVKIPPREIFGALTRQGLDARFEGVLWQLRLPRVLLGLLVGATLSVAGALIQGLFRNPLADSGLIGVSSGAALGAVFVIVLGAVFFPGVGVLSSIALLPVAAFFGALVVTLFIQRLAATSDYTPVATLLLAGVAVNALVNAMIGLSTFLATDAQLRTLAFWTLGSLGNADWKILGIATPICVGLVVLAPLFGPLLNALALGEAEAGHLGFSVERAKKHLIIVIAAGVGACVAFTGRIGFIGLVVPHLVRLWIGPDHRWLLPGSALLGAILLTAADTIARTVFAPAELPIGVITAACGGPFFLFMLLRQRQRALWT
ncbi:MAG: iron ABC transporter permease [Terrimicrobiaceae bacterium]